MSEAIENNDLRFKTLKITDFGMATFFRVDGKVIIGVDVDNGDLELHYQAA